MFTGTWNVNGKPPPAPGSLVSWITLENQKSMDGSRIRVKIPDILVLGFQDLDLSAQSFLLNDSAREEAWSVAISRDLKDAYPMERFVKVL